MRFGAELLLSLPSPRAHLDALIALGLAAATVACFAPSLGYGYAKLDDAMMISANPHVLGGLSGEGVRWAFTNVQTGFYLPLVWLSLMLDTSVFGGAVWGYRLDNVLQHAFTVAAVYPLARRYAPGRLPAALAALAFGLHPARVESVVWLTERKDTLSVALGAAALWCWPAGTRAPGRYWASQALAALAMLAKPSMVVLPVAMALFELAPREADPGGDVAPRGRPWLRRALRPWPAALLALGVGVGTSLAARAEGFYTDYRSFPLVYRLEGLPVHLWEYVSKTLWPRPLSIYFWSHPTPLWPSLAATAGWGLALALLWRSRSRWLQWAVGFFLLTLLPTTNAFYMTHIRIAARYTYLPHLGLAVGLAAAYGGLAPRGRQVAAAAAAAMMLTWAALFAIELDRWRSWESVYRAGLEAEPDNPYLLGAYGQALVFDGRAAEAVPLLRRAVALHTPIEEQWMAAALALEKQEGPAAAAEALAQAQPAVATRPKARLRLLDLCLKAGDLDSARALGEAAQRLGPLDAGGEQVRQKLQRRLAELPGGPGTPVPGCVEAARRLPQ